MTGKQRARLAPLTGQASRSPHLRSTLAGSFAAEGTRWEVPRHVFTGPMAEHESIRLGIFAGLHGDEPATSAAAAKFLGELAEQPEQARGYQVVVYPVCNPTGYAAGTRENFAGLDLNREFWRGSAQPEVRILENELRLHRFDGIIALHADNTSAGLYGYTHGRVLNEALLTPALRAAEAVLPRDPRREIDGFEAREALIRDCFHGVLSAPAEQRPPPFDVIFETPAHAPVAMQVQAALIALTTILAEYRGFIAYAADL